MLAPRTCALVVVAACGGSSATTALFDAAGSGSDFYALPFPNDLRRNDDGSLDLSQFPTNSVIAGQYRDVIETLDGFGMNEAIFARFSDALDPTTLPDPAGSAIIAKPVSGPFAAGPLPAVQNDPAVKRLKSK